MIGTTTLLAVSTLGKFEIRRDAELLTGGNWNRRKVCDLFKVLLSADQHRLHREQIQEMLWPTATIEAAAKPLQVAMRSRATKEQVNASTVQLLEQFDTVLALYKGDYLLEDID